MYRRLALVLILALPVAHHASPVQSIDADVYTAVLAKDTTDGSRVVVVLDSTGTLQFRTGYTPQHHGAFWDSIPEDVRTGFARANRQSRSLAGIGLPHWVRLISRREWTQRDDSLAREHIIAIGGIAVLSAVGYNADSSAALVEVDWPCRGLCGGGDYFWLRREANGEWKIRATASAWVG